MEKSIRDFIGASVEISAGTVRRLPVGTKVIVHTFDRHGNYQSEEGIVVRRSPKRKALAFRDYWDGDNEVRDIRKESDLLCYTEAGS